MTIGQRIKQRREELQISQEELAHKIGYKSRSSINKIELCKYQEGAEYIKKHKLLLFKILIVTYIQFFFYYSISYWIYRALGMNDLNIIQISSIQAILYATVSGIPSPGAVGVSEGGFIEIFKTIYTKDMVSGAMLLNRGVSFYLFVLLSAIIVIIHTIRGKRYIENTNNKVEEDNEGEV